MLSRRGLIVAALMAAVVVVATGCSGARAATEASLPGRTITVVGSGTASGAPDVAEVTLGIESRDPSVQVAAEANAEAMSGIIAALKSLGIAEKDIQTANYSIYTERKPMDERELTEAAEVTYVVSNQVRVKVRDLSKLSDVLDEAVIAGANSVYGIGFTVDDPSALEAEARAKAVEDAGKRAQSLADLAGVGVGQILTISEVIGSSFPVAYAESARGMGVPTPVEPGELEVGMTVQVTYAIR